MNTISDTNRRRFLRAALLSPFVPGLIAGTAHPVFGQLAFHDPEADAKPVGGPRIGSGQTQRYRAGVKIRANGSSMDGVTIAVPVPMDWGDEQQIKMVDEKTEPGVKLDYLKRPRGVPTSNMAVFTARKLNATRELEMYVTVEVTRHETLPPPPEECARLIIPKRPPRGFGPYYSKSPKIECDNAVFLRKFKEIVATLKDVSDWAKVEAIYDHVRDTISYEDGVADKEAKGAHATLTDGKDKGDCKDMSFLFIALCRAGKIPARTVRMPTHCYAEFYLEDPSAAAPVSTAPDIEASEEEMGGKKRAKPSRKAPVSAPVGHWFPCQLAGDRAFGGISDFNPILQKGDDFAELDDPKNKEYFAKEQFYAEDYSGPKPKITFIHDLTAK